jgi:hypothetical protein
MRTLLLKEKPFIEDGQRQLLRITCMGADIVIFLEVIEWFDESGRELPHRIPEKGSCEIKDGAHKSF